MPATRTSKPRSSKPAPASTPESPHESPHEHAVRHAVSRATQAEPGQGSDTASSAEWLGELETPAAPTTGARIDSGGKQAPATPAVESHRGAYKS